MCSFIFGYKNCCSYYPQDRALLRSPVDAANIIEKILLSETIYGNTISLCCCANSCVTVYMCLNGIIQLANELTSHSSSSDAVCLTDICV